MALYINGNKVVNSLVIDGKAGVNVLKGTVSPSSLLGSNGQIYLQYSSSDDEISGAYAKVEGVWQNLIGTDISDIDTHYFGKDTIIYGFSISDSTVTYLADAVGMTPAQMDFTNDVFSYGSWENAFFMPKPCMLKYDGTVDYYLDPNDYSKKADGTASDIDNDNYTGNAMMEWGKIWVKVVPDGNDVSIYISNRQVDTSFVAWWNYDGSGVLKDHFYMPIYNGSIVNNGSNNVLRSLSGKTYSQLCMSETATAERTMAGRNGTGWDTEVYADLLILDYLLILMGKSLNVQSVYGKGRCNKSQGASNMLGTGTMDTKGMFWGSNTTDYGVKVFGMENRWGNQYRRIAGLINVNRTWKYKLTKGTTDGSTASDYNTDGTGYLTQSHTSPASDGWIKYMYFNTDGSMYIKEVGTNNYADYSWKNNGSKTAYFTYGGFSNDNTDRVGIFYWNCGEAYSSNGYQIGTSLSYK